MKEWYLVRTKPGREGLAESHLKRVVERTLLPLAKTRVCQRDRSFNRVTPIFPSYIFAFFSLGQASRSIRYTPGVRDIVRFGERAAVVPAAVVEELAARCAHGPVDLAKPALASGSPLKVVVGPFRELRAVFDGYLSGTDRVAVLLSLLNAERRIVLPASMVVAAE